MERRKFNQSCPAKLLGDCSRWVFSAGDVVLVRERQQDQHRVTFQYEGSRMSRGPYEAKWPDFDMCSEEIPRGARQDD